ncbi:MAG: Trk transport system, NAD-binding component [Actinomycetia bacterium]|nr:Trk transport system, NAD-binding component [Actinomycetes bacterium]
MEELVTAVVPKAESPLARRMARLGARIVEGPAREMRTLRAAGVHEARALALVEDDDVGNVHASLAAQDLNPGVRLVVRMFNLRLARRIDGLFDDCTVLSAGAIAAPFFVSAALGDGRAQLLRIGDRQLAAGPPSAVHDPLAVLAGAGPAGAKILLPDTEVGATLLLGTPTDPETEVPAPHGPLGAPTPAPVPTPRRRRTRSRGRTAALLSMARALISFRLRVVAGTLLALVAGSTAIFHTAVPKLANWLDAFYFTVTTFTSTGNADLSDLGASTTVKVFGALLMLLGVLTVAVVTAVVVDDLIGARLAHSSGVPVGHRSGHVVLCGLGTVGLRVAEQLREAGADVVAIDREPDPAAYAAARRLGIPLIHGDASEEEVLRVANVGTARCLVAVTDDDVANLEAGLASRAFRADIRVVLRLFDNDLAHRVGKRLDLSISRSVSVAAAPVFAAAMMGREVIAAIPSGRRVLLVAEVPVSGDSVAAGGTIAMIDEPGSARVLCHVKRGYAHWAPARSNPIAADDHLIVVATRAGLTETMLLAGPATEDLPA